MPHVHEGVFPDRALPGRQVPDYRLAVTYRPTALPETIADDPYRHLPTLGEMDLHLIGEGRHEELWRVLGAHVQRPGRTGTSFAVWAPNARGVRVIGDFNHWDGRGPPDALARRLGHLGAVRARRRRRDPVQVRVCGPDGSWRRKADPMASLAEQPPATASVVFASAYEWADGEWLAGPGRARAASR